MIWRFARRFWENKVCRRVLSLGCAVALLMVLIASAGADNLLSALGNVTALSMIALLAVSIPLVLISVIKWRSFLLLYGPTPSLWRLSELYLVGYFVNLFVPSQLGGDIVRSISLATPGSRAQAAVCTFLERFTGLLAMVFFALCGVVLTDQPPVIAGVVFVIFSVAWGGAIGLWCGLPIQVLPWKKVTDILFRVEESLKVVRSAPLLLLRAFFLSLLFHLVTIVNTQVAAWAIGVPLPSWIDLAVVVPLILLIGGLPLTPSGIGIQEGAWVYFLGYAGVSPADSLAISVVLRAKTYLLGLCGGIVMVRDRNRVRGRSS